MQLIPAIDIRDGVCVRLLQGDPARQITYGATPADIARQFYQAGASRIHVVDLDGAIEGASANEGVVRELVEAVPVEVELGGGIRTLDGIGFWLECGVSQVILGTAVVERPDLAAEAVGEFGAGHIIVGIDARDGRVATHGWQTESGETDTAFAGRMAGMGVERFIYTAIETDGMMAGPNLEALRRFAEATTGRVTASGGIRHLEDILQLEREAIPGIDSVIAGRAIYENRLDVARAFRVLGTE